MSKTLQRIVALLEAEVMRNPSTGPTPISADDGSTPVAGEPRHFLRRTDTSPLSARARHVYVMQQMGHTDPKPALRIYAKVISEQRRRAPARAW